MVALDPLLGPIPSIETRTVAGVQLETLPLDVLQVSRTNTWFPAVAGDTRLVASDEKAMNRPSELMAWREELLEPLLDPPVGITDTMAVEGVQLTTGPFDELHISRTKTLMVRPPPAAGS